MRYWIFAALVLIISIGFRDIGQPQRHYSSLANKIRHPFDSRIHYRIGQIDPQFNLSNTEVINFAAEAAQIWHVGTSKTLFVYDPNASLSINLRFDNRQLESNLKRSQQDTLTQQLSEQQNNNDHYQQRQIQLQQQRQQLDNREAAFQQQLSNYNRSVTDWNTLGNIDTYQRQQLRQKQQLLDVKRQEILSATEQYNQQVNALNQVANSLNQAADQYNQNVEQLKSQFKPREFEKGHFDGQQIDIYEFSSPADLRLTIAHELGHALGLNHNNDPYALMYPILKQQDIDNFQLRSADLALLNQR